MEISSETQWWHPVRLRIAKKVVPSRNVGVVFEPIISQAERTGFGYQAPDRCVGANIVLAGPQDMEDGRLEFWLTNTFTGADEYPFVYFCFEDVEWCGSVGRSDERFEFVYTHSRTSGRRALLSFRSAVDRAKSEGGPGVSSRDPALCHQPSPMP